MANKYELIESDTVQYAGSTLYRIRALVAVGLIVAAGDVGGYVESEKNLDQSGDAWVYGDAQVSGDAQIVWFSKVGSENGTLTVYRSKDNTLLVTRGCFSGTDEQFLDAVDQRHGNGSKISREYHLLIEVARSRIALGESTPEADRATEAAE